MYTFYICAGLEPATRKRSLERVAEVSQELMPIVDSNQPSLKVVHLPEISGGYFVLADEVTEILFDHLQTAEFSVFFYGELFDNTIAGAANRVAETFKQGGAEAVHRLNGLFSAVIIERLTGRLHLLSDAIGSRTCLYRTTDQGALHISAHDIPLVAAGGLELELDRISVTAALTYDWSIGGRSFLQGIETSDPFTHLTWHKQVLEKSPASTLLGKERLTSLQDPQVEHVIDEMIELLVSSVANIAKDKQGLTIDLTAGLDSRAILAIAMQAVGAKNISARTNGSPRTLDAKVAQKLATNMDIEYGILEPDLETKDKLPEFANAVAFGLNGDFCAKNVWMKHHDKRDLARPHLSGAGGEIFRGFYYPTREISQMIHITPVDAVRKQKFDRSFKLPWASEQDTFGMRERLETILGRLQTISGHPADVLDLYYTHERVAHWGVHQERHPLRFASHSPFKQPQLARLAFRLPPASGAYEYLHAALINRFTPDFTWTLINGESIVLPINASRSNRLKRSLTMSAIKTRKQAYELLPWRLRQRLDNNADIYMANLFSGPLKEYTHDTLLAEDSIALQVLTRDGLVKMLHDHPSLEDYTEEFGLLIVMNSWWRLVKRAKQLAVTTEVTTCVA